MSCGFCKYDYQSLPVSGYVISCHLVFAIMIVKDYLCQQFHRLFNVVDPNEVVLVKVVDLERVVKLRLSWGSLAQRGEEKEEFVKTFLKCK